MKQHEVEVGGTYIAKVNDKLTKVRIDGVSPHGGWDATNLATGKKVRIKSPARLRGEAGAKGKAKKQADAPATAPEAAPAVDAAPAEKKPRKKAPRADGTLSGLDAAAKVLAEAGQPLNAKEILERIQAQGLWKTNGKTPEATIYAAVLREIARKGEASRFRKAERGKFAAAS